MAKGRFISKAIATDRELNVLCSFEADYLFQRCVPHLDVDGRMGGFADVVKATACPLRRELSVEMVRACLAELQEHDLVRWYDVENRRYLEFPGFTEHQKGLRRNREADSKIPPANSSDANPVEYSGPTPGVLRSRSAQEKFKFKSKSKGSTEGSSLRSSPSEDEPRVEKPQVEEESWNDRLAPVIREAAYHGEGPPEGHSLSRCLSKAKQLMGGGYTVDDLEDAIRGLRRMAETKHEDVRGWLEPGDRFTVLAFGRAEEKGQKLVQVAAHEWRKGNLPSDQRRRSGPVRVSEVAGGV